ncbi:hypothetical protein BZA77DRAFT_301483 [Pyronema omphalodes]|nr:hypothetical protein BZA77DRAFT_301483 [Pyronema omphalodes]
MRPIFLLPLLSLLALANPIAEAEAEALAEANPEADPEPISYPEANKLEKRACKNNGCQCAAGSSGIYCWACAGVTRTGDTTAHTGDYRDWVYQCDGTKCCTYGVRNSCKGGKKNPCGG